jgi:phospholipase D1/2
VASIHTKHHLEALHPNIAVFRHPDHNPSTHTLAADFKNLWNKGRVELAKLPSEGMEALYGFADDVVLYWAHHEKLCLIDGKIAFMGGLDACFGRWDTNQHQIADAHPADIKDTIFPGQDYNNARVFDFQNIEEWDQNKLDRTKDARMGWSDLSISLEGPVIEDLGAHFVQRWNFIYDSKYTVRGNSRYQPLSLGIPDVDPDDSAYHLDGRNRIFGTASHKLTGQHAFADPEDDVPQPAGAFPSTEEGHHHHRTPGEYFHQMKSRFRRGMESFAGDRPKPLGVMNVQLVRSCGRWSHGVSTEVSPHNPVW